MFHPLDFKYKFSAGTLNLDKLNTEIKEGNCRLAIQLFYYFYFYNFIPSEQILCPYSHRSLGETVGFNRNERELINKAKRGDIIFAEIIKNSREEKVNRTRNAFETEDQWITSLHSAIYLGFPDKRLGDFFDSDLDSYEVPLIFHASAVSKGTAIWDINKFNEYYKIVRIKRLQND